jgi:hypothetical protein
MTSPSPLALRLALPGVATPEAMQRAMEGRMHQGGSVLFHLVLHGVLPDTMVAAWFARRYQIPRVDPALLQHVPDDVVRLLPVELLYEASMMPLRRVDSQTLLVGWVDPTESGRLDEAEFFAGCVVRPQILSALEMTRLFERVTGRSWRVSAADLELAQQARQPLQDRLHEIDRWMDEVHASDAAIDLHEQPPPDIRTEDFSEPVGSVAGQRSVTQSAEVPLPDLERLRVVQRSQATPPPPAAPAPVLPEEPAQAPGVPPGQRPVTSRIVLDPVPVIPPGPAPTTASPPEALPFVSGESGQDISHPALATGTFRAPTQAQIKQEQERRRQAEALPEVAAAMPQGRGVRTDTDTGDSPHLPPEGRRAPDSGMRHSARSGSGPTPTPPGVTGAHAVVQGGTFGRPLRLFDSTGPALGVGRAAFRSLVKSLDHTQDRTDIGREIAEGLSLLYPVVLLYTLRLPDTVLWASAMRRHRAFGRSLDFCVEEGSVWERVAQQAVAYRGRLPADDPLRQRLGRALGHDTLVAPITMNRRTIALLVLDAGPEQTLMPCGGMYEQLEHAISQALRRMIVNSRRRPQWQAP